MMARRLLIAQAAFTAGLVLIGGCGGQVAPMASPNQQARAESGPSKGPEAVIARPARPTKPGVRISPEVFTITADDAGLQLLASDETDLAHDRTAEVRWTTEPADLAIIEPGGYLRPTSAGVVTVRALIPNSESGESPIATAKITIDPRSARAWDFGEDIVPILTRMGCNTGACHGRLEGQNGFHLSLFGYDPVGDYPAIVRDASQRKVSRLEPDQSLFLLKATGRAPHVGGPRVVIGSPEHQILLAWIRDGAPDHRGKSHGTVESVEIEPAGALRLEGPGTRQLRIMARYADGHRRDVTRLASFKVNDDSAASVTPQGRVSLLRRAETDLIVRYESHVLDARVSTVINPELALDFSKLTRRNFIDNELFKRLESLKVPPSPRSTDAAFLRRISLDLTGEQPLPDEVRGFLADKDPDKRSKLIDLLIAKKEFLLFWKLKMGDLLQISTARQGNGAARYHTWIERCLAENRPWDVMVRTLLTAVGDPNDLDNGGPVNYALDSPLPTEQAELTAQRFLGLRMRCAQCHDHPFDIWTQDAYYGLASFFAKVQRGGAGPGAMMGRDKVTINPKGEVIHLRTKKPTDPRLLDGKTVKIPPADDPRKALADWMTASNNPYFARAMVNWVWAQLFGRGLVDPPDDMSRANPPVHPELLDALARHFVEHKFDLRDLIRTITSSEAYGLTSATVTGNEKDTRLFSHHIPRPLTAHQMADALAQATSVPNVFQNQSGGKNVRRALQIYDPAMPSPLLDSFGRCSRTVACAASPAPSLSLRQALLLIGGDVIEGKVSSLNGYLASALKLELEPEELVENLYYRTVCRPPTPEELSRWSAELKNAASLSEAAQDLFWALLNSREFAFNH